MAGDSERFDKLFARAFVVLSVAVFAALGRVRGMEWAPAVTMGLTVGAVAYLSLRLTGGPSRYMGGSADGAELTMPPRRTLVLLGACAACSLVAWVAEGGVAAVFGTLALLAGAGLLLTRARP